VRRLLIALDVDGVLANFLASALVVVEEVTGKHYEVADVKGFDFLEALDLSTEEKVAVKKAIGARQGFAASLAPYPEAREGVPRLHELGDVFCVTSSWKSNPWWKAERDAWCAKHFGINVVHHSKDKSGYKADIFVDGKFSNVRSWHAAWPARVAVFWRTPQNASEPVPVGACSMDSWDDFYALARNTAFVPWPLPRPLEKDSR